jgi:anti-sigma regulatory factor (Ser/Thr protein kinase)
MTNVWGGGERLEECVDFECDPRVVALARAFVGMTLRSWKMPGLSADVELLTSELVTNAVLHARTALRLKLSYDHDGLTVSVLDGNVRLPAVAGIPDDATSGHGLLLVERLSDSWGVEHNTLGKTVWARIASQPVSPPGAAHRRLATEGPCPCRAGSAVHRSDGMAT